MSNGKEGGPPTSSQTARELLAKKARRDSESLAFWAGSCRTAMRRAGRDASACRSVTEAAQDLRQLARTLEDSALYAVGEEAHRRGRG